MVKHSDSDTESDDDDIDSDNSEYGSSSDEDDDVLSSKFKTINGVVSEHEIRRVLDTAVSRHPEHADANALSAKLDRMKCGPFTYVPMGNLFRNAADEIATGDARTGTPLRGNMGQRYAGVLTATMGRLATPIQRDRIRAWFDLLAIAAGNYFRDPANKSQFESVKTETRAQALAENEEIKFIESLLKLFKDNDSKIAAEEKKKKERGVVKEPTIELEKDVGKMTSCVIAPLVLADGRRKYAIQAIVAINMGLHGASVQEIENATEVDELKISNPRMNNPSLPPSPSPSPSYSSPSSSEVAPSPLPQIQPVYSPPPIPPRDAPPSPQKEKKKSMFDQLKDAVNKRRMGIEPDESRRIGSKVTNMLIESYYNDGNSDPIRQALRPGHTIFPRSEVVARGKNPGSTSQHWVMSLYDVIHSHESVGGEYGAEKGEHITLSRKASSVSFVGLTGTEPTNTNTKDFANAGNLIRSILRQVDPHYYDHKDHYKQDRIQISNIGMLLTQYFFDCFRRLPLLVQGGNGIVNITQVATIVVRQWKATDDGMNTRAAECRAARVLCALYCLYEARKREFDELAAEAASVYANDQNAVVFLPSASRVHIDNLDLSAHVGFRVPGTENKVILMNGHQVEITPSKVAGPVVSMNRRTRKPAYKYNGMEVIPVRDGAVIKEKQ